MNTCLSHSPQDTEQAGFRLAKELLSAGKRSALILLYGEMGVGKTAFTRGFAAALGISGVRSPTYTVVNEHRDGILPLFHFDLYRIADEDELYGIGFEDYLASDGFCLCEWSECIPELASYENVRTVTISRTETDENQRTISFS